MSILPRLLFTNTVGLTTTDNGHHNFVPIKLRQVKIRNDVDFYRTEPIKCIQLQLAEIYYDSENDCYKFIKSYLQKGLEVARHNLEFDSKDPTPWYWIPSLETDCNMTDPDAFSISSSDERVVKFSADDFYEDRDVKCPRLIVFLTELGSKVQYEARKNLIKYLEDQIERIDYILKR